MDECQFLQIGKKVLPQLFYIPYLLNKSGSGVFWAGFARPKHPTSPFFLRRYYIPLEFFRCAVAKALTYGLCEDKWLARYIFLPVVFGKARHRRIRRLTK
jgi:hypothetical protein